MSDEEFDLSDPIANLNTLQRRRGQVRAGSHIPKDNTLAVRLFAVLDDIRELTGVDAVPIVDSATEVEHPGWVASSPHGGLHFTVTPNTTVAYGHLGLRMVIYEPTPTPLQLFAGFGPHRETMSEITYDQRNDKLTVAVFGNYFRTHGC